MFHPFFGDEIYLEVSLRSLSFPSGSSSEGGVGELLWVTTIVFITFEE